MIKLRQLFQSAGFRIVYAMKDDLYMLVPLDKREQAKYGTPVFSPRAMQALEKELSA